MRLEVDLVGLGDTVLQLRSALGVARDVADHRASLMELVEDYGSGRLRSAVDSFFRQWGYGMALIAEDAGNPPSMLEGTVAAYEEVERSIGDGCR